jgi:hypothetical protein
MGILRFLQSHIIQQEHQPQSKKKSAPLAPTGSGQSGSCERMEIRQRSRPSSPRRGRGAGSCEKIAKTDGVGGRASPRAALGAGLPDNRLARTLALPIFSQLPGEGLGVRGNPTEWIRTRNPALDEGVGALQDQSTACSPHHP